MPVELQPWVVVATTRRMSRGFPRTVRLPPLVTRNGLESGQVSPGDHAARS